MGTKWNRPIRETISSSSLSLIGIPERFKTTTIKDFNDYGLEELKEVKKFIKKYLEDFTPNVYNNLGLFFSGSNGVGKTMLACILAKEAYKHRLSTKRVTFVEYINMYTRVWNARGLEEVEEVTGDFNENYKCVDFLVLEEVGKEIDSKISVTVLEECLRYRDEKSLVTIICSNLDLHQINKRYGESVVSLIKGNFQFVTIVDVPDRRTSFKK